MMIKDITKDQQGPRSVVVSYSLFRHQKFGRKDLLVLILYKKNLETAGHSKGTLFT